MKVYREAIYNTLDANFTVNPSIHPRDAWLKLEEVLDSYFKALGGCEICFGKGYTIQDDPYIARKENAIFRFCKCERGLSLERAGLLERKD